MNELVLLIFYMSVNVGLREVKFRFVGTNKYTCIVKKLSFFNCIKKMCHISLFFSFEALIGIHSFKY